MSLGVKIAGKKYRFHLCRQTLWKVTQSPPPLHVQPVWPTTTYHHFIPRLPKCPQTEITEHSQCYKYDITSPATWKHQGSQCFTVLSGTWHLANTGSLAWTHSQLLKSKPTCVVSGPRGAWYKGSVIEHLCDKAEQILLSKWATGKVQVGTVQYAWESS